MKKHTYLENTKDNHSKFYEMNENPDGASFTATWGKIGTTGRTQIYGMNEWAKIYVGKLNKGYRDTAKKKIHYDVGQVDIVVNHSHMNKLRILHMTLHNWEKNNGQLPMDSQRGRLYEADLHKVEELTERGTETMLESDTEFLGTSEFLTKEEMVDMNILFKTYGGKRVTQ